MNLSDNKKNGNSSKTILLTIILVVLGLCIVGSIANFHIAAFAFQLLIPILIIYALVIFLIITLIRLLRAGFFTGKRLKYLFIGILVITVLAVFGFNAWNNMITDAYKSLPDIVYTGDYIGHMATNLGHEEQDQCVIWDSESNEYTSHPVDDELFDVLDKHEYDQEDEQCLEGTEYEGTFVRRSCLDSNTQKVYMTIGGNSNDQFDPYHKLLCYDTQTESLELIIDIDTSISDFDISNDGSYIVYETKDKLVRYDILSEESIVIKEGIQQEMKSASDEYFVRLSKDGKYIMYFYGSTKFNRFHKYIFIYDVENDSIQKVQVKLSGFYNAE